MHVRASARGLRAIMETMLHGSQFYMLFKEAFHIYGSFFLFLYTHWQYCITTTTGPGKWHVGGFCYY